MLARFLDLEIHLVARVIEDRLRDAYASGLGNGLEARRDVDAVAKDVMGFDDDVADIEPHTEENAAAFGVAAGQFIDTGLELHGSPDRFDRAGKLRQEAVAGVLDNAAAVLRNRGLDTSGEERGQFGVRSLFVIVHEPGIAGYVGGQDRR
nr:hypothetical protein [Bradyrhizobium sp.]